MTTQLVKIAHIVAHDENFLIGKGDDHLPWKIKEDLDYFRELTLGHALVMGRKTHFSIGRPLPHRKNIVISRTPQYLKGVDAVCEIRKGLELAFDYAIAQKQERIFVIGGGEIYNATRDMADEVFLTLVKGQHEGDRYYRMPNNMVQDECQGEMTNGVETFFFKHYSRMK